MSNDEAKIRKLENRITHWETHLAESRAHLEAVAQKKIDTATTDAQRDYWQEYKRAGLARIQLREDALVEPMREEYRRLLGLDQ